MTENTATNRPDTFISLRLKVAATLLVVLCAGLAISLKLATDYQSNQIMSQAEREAGIMTGVVYGQINAMMLKGHTDDAQDILSGLGRNDKVVGAWLSNHEGIVVASSNPKFLGGNISDHNTLTGNGNPDGSVREGTSLNPAESLFTQTIRFDNKPECRRCHLREGPVLGWLTVVVSLDDALSGLSHMKRTMAAAAALLGLTMALTAFFLITRLINRPIEKLASAMKTAETDLDAEVQPGPNDELRVLSDGFNTLMARLRKARADADRLHSDELGRYSRELETANADLDDKLKKLSALSVVGRHMIETRKLDDLIKMILNTALRELHGESGSVMMFEKLVGELLIHCGTGLSPEGHRKNRFKLGEGIAGWVAMHKKPAVIECAIEDERYVPGRGTSHAVPILSVPLIGSSGGVLGVINIERGGPDRPFTGTDLEYLIAIAGQASVAIENVELISNLQKSYYDTISALAMTVEAKDPYTLGHSKRVTQYAMAIADELGLSNEDIQTIQYGSTLHDIGKIGVRGTVLNKPDMLTSEEYEEIKDHAVIGENIVKGVDFLQKTRPIIRNHQERFDGKGYPDGLKGEEIPLAVAIVSVADNFDALTTDRPYRKAYPAVTAIEVIKRESGGKFHPDVVNAFLRIFES